MAVDFLFIHVIELGWLMSYEVFSFVTTLVLRVALSVCQYIMHVPCTRAC